jgi:uncharacterized protein
MKLLPGFELEFRFTIQSKSGIFTREEHRYLALSEADDFATWEVFRQYDDKAWSYTDCSILVMAHRLKIMEVIAFDEHIRQMAWLGILCIP